MNYKTLSETATLPCRGDPEAAGYDLYSSEATVVEPWSRKLVKTDIALEIPTGYYGRIASRSGLASKGKDVGAGVIDSSYRGEIKVLLINSTSEAFGVGIGDRIAQIIFEKHFSFEMNKVETLSASDRGANGFGSTGN